MNPVPCLPNRTHPEREFGCPACRMRIGTCDRCPHCGFTGAQTVAMFPGPPPRWQPVMDGGQVWDGPDLKLIERARQQLDRRFPQFRWHLCSVNLPPDRNLRLFGFWLHNVCPLAAGETLTDRIWTVLLVVNATTHETAVVPGYAAEVGLSAAHWEQALASMKAPWQAGHPGKAVAAFLTTAGALLETSWRTLTADPRD